MDNTGQYWTSTGGTRIQFFEFEELTEAPAVGAIPVCVGVIIECLRYWGHATGGYGGHRWGAEPVLTGMTFDEVSAWCWGKYLWLLQYTPMAHNSSGTHPNGTPSQTPHSPDPIIRIQKVWMEHNLDAIVAGVEQLHTANLVQDQDRSRCRPCCVS